MQKLTITAPTFTVELTADNERDLIKQAAFWQSIPSKCPVCQKPVVFEYTTPQTYKYYKLKCTGDPSHSTNFGVKKEGSDLYYDAGKRWEVFLPGREGDRQDTPEQTPANNAGSGANAGGNAPIGVTGPAAEAYGPNAPIGVRKNVLTKLIRDCKDAGLRTGLIQGDVGGLDDAGVNEWTEKLSTQLKNEYDSNR